MFLWGFRQLEKSGGEKQGSGGTAETGEDPALAPPPPPNQKKKQKNKNTTTTTKKKKRKRRGKKQKKGSDKPQALSSLTHEPSASQPLWL